MSWLKTTEEAAKTSNIERDGYITRIDNRAFLSINVESGLSDMKEHMKPESPAHNFSNGSRDESHNINGRPASLIAAFLASGLLLAGCATENPERMVTGSRKVLSDAARFQLGIVGIATPVRSAAFSFDKSDGRIDYATE